MYVSVLLLLLLLRISQSDENNYHVTVLDFLKDKIFDAKNIVACNKYWELTLLKFRLKIFLKIQRSHKYCQNK